VVDGNERVIRPRLSDAAFFFAQDKQSTLEARRERLRNIVFQTELGSLWDKTERVARARACDRHSTRCRSGAVRARRSARQVGPGVRDGAGVR
jgi:glycyl-tRNA synthetase beta chain